MELTGKLVPWCGPCERDFVKWLCHMQHRRWRGHRFYDLAHTPWEER